MMIDKQPYYLYVHIPFCAHICSYCDFVHQIYQEKIVDAWLEALAEEIAHKHLRKDLRTIYLGGGTPVSLNERQLERLLGLLEPYSSFIQEYTIEINPEVLTEEKVKLLAKYHVNRASLGFQTDNSALLARLGRKADADMVLSAMNLLRKYGITNLSLDLMYSLPGQTMEDLKHAIMTAVSFNPTHLSLYSLTIEENTVFGKTGVEHLDDETEADMYDLICAILPEYGFHQYEISNFALAGKESVHNKAYWYYDDFIGMGAGASGKEGNCRYDHTRHIQEYIKDPLSVISIPLTKEDEIFEAFMMGMRLKKGICISAFNEKWQIDLLKYYQTAVENNLDKGLLEIAEDHLRCTPRGYEILNTILEDFLEI